ncbi:MAG: hypothetical protein LBU53_04195 [Zoogloeaceae bacterium]|jgi:hypothetical protein|nr:hypothetical protein [Zoogloeaceae bacterium]
MSGLILLAIIGLFVAVLNFFRKWLFSCCGKKLDTHKIRLVANVVFWVFAFTLPVADEIIGAFQFRALCDTNTTFKIDAEKIKGKTVNVVLDPLNKKISGLMLPVDFTRQAYRDAETNEEYASLIVYDARGGWLMRSLWEPSGTLFIQFPTCYPKNSKGVREYGVTILSTIIPK